MKNCYGEIISGIKQLQKPEFGTGEIDQAGNPVVDWTFLSEFADVDGFDIRNIENNRKYAVIMKLPYGTQLIRYGYETGVYTAPIGTKYEDLALPYIVGTVPYYEYNVIADEIEVVCIVKKGIVAPGFNSRGGAVQYMHSMSMMDSVKQGILERKLL